MATYLPSISDYVPQVQAFKPDLNFYQNVLQRKQAKYDQGFEQVSSMYNSILNAPMLRDGNIAKRDNFFKQAETEIQRLSGIDLSLDQNVEAAYGIFKPFYEDDNIVNDMSWTRKYQSEMSKAEAFRNCTDEKTCGGKYWDGGMRALNYRAEEFKNATDSDALNMRTPTYTPYKNMMKMATEAAKDAGLSVKYDKVQNGYIVTTKNGPELQIPLANYFMQTFGDDPELMDFYTTKAYLMRKENPDAADKVYNSAINPVEGMNAEDVDKRITSETFNSESAYIKSKAGEESNRLEVLMQKKELLDKGITKKGINPDSAEGKEYLQLIEDIEAQKRFSGTLNTTAERASEISVKNTNLSATNAQMDAVIAQSLMFKDIEGAAISLSYKDYEQTIEADPYALEATKHRNSIALANLQASNSLQLEGAKQMMKVKTDRLDYLMKEGILDESSMEGILDLNDPLDQQVAAAMTRKGNYKASISGTSTYMSFGQGGIGDILNAVVKQTNNTNNIDDKLNQQKEENPTGAWYNFSQKYKEIELGQAIQGISAKSTLSNNYLSNLLNLANDTNDSEDSKASRQELTYMGNRIQWNIKQMKEAKKKGQSTPLDNIPLDVLRKLEKWPSDIKDAQNISADYFSSVNDNMSEVKAIMGGDDKFFKYITQNKGNVGIKSRVGSIKDQMNSSEAKELLGQALITDASTKTIKSGYNSAGRNAAKRTANQYSGDNDFYTKFVSKNIWVDGEEGKYGRTKTKGELYNERISKLNYKDYNISKQEGDVERGASYTGSEDNTKYKGNNSIISFEKDNDFKTSPQAALNMIMRESVFTGGSEQFHNSSLRQLATDVQRVSGKKIPGNSERALKAYLANNMSYLEPKRTSANNLAVKVRGSKNAVGFNIANINVNDGLATAIKSNIKSIDNVYDNVLKEFIDFNQAEQSPYGNGMGSFASAPLSLNISPLSDKNNLAHTLEFVGEVATSGRAIPISGANTEFLNSFIQDFGVKWTSQSKGMPRANTTISPIAGEKGVSELTITYDQNYLQAKGYNKYNQETQKYDLNPMSPTQKFKIRDSKSKIISKSIPNAYDVKLAHPGDSYTDYSFGSGDNDPKISYKNVGNNRIQIKVFAPEFDDEVGKYDNDAYEVIEVDKSEIDWNNYTKELYKGILQGVSINQQREANYNKTNGVRDPRQMVRQ